MIEKLDKDKEFVMTFEDSETWFDEYMGSETPVDW